jgi:2-polyprenyl-6-methoxyphenol hydroxylase-like FAD-dependent oxidoreductase
MAPSSSEGKREAGHLFDVAIVGAGFAGSALAAALARQGYRIAVFDARETYPDEFRAEKMSDRHIAALARLGLAEPVLRVATFFDEILVARRGRIVERRPVREYGVAYAAMVAALRAAVPPACWAGGRVRAIDATAERQVLTLDDGHAVAARLTVVATGLGKTLLGGLGIERVEVARDHSLAIGFDLACPVGAAARRALTYHGHAIANRVAYLTLFPIGDRLRANLFTYHRHDEEWCRAFRADPRGALLSAMPGLDTMVPDMTIVSRPILRPIHLHVSAGHVRDGVVLIGDAFATTCPTGGSGVYKALTDIERLLPHAATWLAAPRGAEADAIHRFYEDPVKRAWDTEARRRIRHARAMALDPGFAWAFRRQRNYIVQRLRHLARTSLAWRFGHALSDLARPEADRDAGGDFRPLYLSEKKAISYRPDDSIRSESALEAMPLRAIETSGDHRAATAPPGADTRAYASPDATAVAAEGCGAGLANAG